MPAKRAVEEADVVREVPTVRQRLEEAVNAHNQIHTGIQQAEEQLVAARAERERLFGRIQLLQELAQEEEEANPSTDDE